MRKQTISITDQHSDWLKAQVSNGQYGSASEVIRDMIRERQMKEQETPDQIERIRQLLEAGLASGVSETDPRDLLDMFKAELR